MISDETLPDPMPSPVINAGMAEPAKSDIRREEPDPDDSTLALISRWQGRITKAKGHWDKDFRRMEGYMKFASGDQWLTKDSTNYKANIVQRHIQQRVAALYAKNPRAVVRRRKRLDFSQWDGSLKQLEILQQQMAQALTTGMPPDPGVMEKLMDIAQGVQSRTMLDKIAQTLEIVYAYILDTQFPPHKIMLKQLIRRVLVCGFGWTKVGYQRLAGKRPDDIAKITGITEQIAKLERLLADVTDGECEKEQAEYVELTQMLKKLQSEPEAIVHEGLTFDFPDTRNIIVDPKCKHLRTLLGAQWVAEEFKLSADDVKEIYKVDPSTFSGYAHPSGDPSPAPTEGETCPGVVCVWEVYDKTTGTVFTIAEGCKDYLRPPAAPVVKLARFWPYFGLSFTELEADGDCVSIYPISDVGLLEHQQKEYNRQREALRRHRIANSPKIAVATGALSDTDKDVLQSADPLGVSVLELQGLQPGQKPDTLLAPIQMPPLDPNLYDTEGVFSDVLRVVGTQEANLGGTAGGTATESSIAESSRMSSMASNVDDLDDMLTEMARAAGEVLLLEMSQEKAKEIAGTGAAWPDLSRQEIADELILEIQAGSSGRPNKAAEIANFEKLVPLLIQIPGIDPMWLAKEAIKRMDDRLDPTDAIVAGIPSIVAMNSMQMKAAMGGGQPQPGDAGSDPSAQGAQGANNAPAPPGRAGTDGGNEAAAIQPGAVGGM